MESFLAAVALVLALLAPAPARAQVTCPTTASDPAFTAGGSVFGRQAGQWNEYFRAKADVNSPVLCNPTIVGATYVGSPNLQCSSLTDGGTACPADTGTSGHTLPYLDADNLFTGQQTFRSVMGSTRTVSGSSDLLTSTDCGKTIVYTSASGVNVTTFANAASGVSSCSIALLQRGAGAVTIVDGAGATKASADNCTKTAAQYATMGLFVQPNDPSMWIILGRCAP